MRRYSICLLLLFLVSCQLIQAQSFPAKYRIIFTDKDNNPYSLNQPLDYLSQRAIDRRSRQDIPLNASDLPLTPAYVTGVIASGASLLSSSKWLNSLVALVPDSTVLAQLQALPYVAGIDYASQGKKGSRLPEGWKDKWQIFNELNKSPKAALPFAPRYSRKAGKGLDYGASLNQVAMIKGDVLHNRGFTGKGMIIAVLDAGFYKVDEFPAFDSLWMNNRILGTRDFVEPGSDIFEQSSHGMMVLSVMGANVPGEMVGTAPSASYWLLRSEDANSEYPVEEDYWVNAAEFADSLGADIINSSLGYTVYDDMTLSHTYNDMNGNTTVVTRGADMAAAKGMLVVNSAGNSGGSFWQYIGAPADGDSVLSIGAVNESGQIAGFSSGGPTFDGRVKPSVVAQGEGTLVYGGPGWVFPGNGTSFSSPVMAGAAACLWQAHPQATNMEIYQAILQSADRYLMPDFDYGYGIPDLAKADLELYRPPDVIPALPVFIYPNPSSDVLVIHFFENDYRDISFQLYDYCGRKIVSDLHATTKPGSNLFTFTGTESLPAGLYLLRYQHSDAEYLLKWLKM